MFLVFAKKIERIQKFCTVHLPKISFPTKTQMRKVDFGQGDLRFIVEMNNQNSKFRNKHFSNVKNNRRFRDIIQEIQKKIYIYIHKPNQFNSKFIKN